MQDDLSDTDPELLEIFLEEAEDITTALSEALTSLQAEPQAEGAMSNLLRGLHTLKGGARMSGLMELGEAVHNLETTLIEQHEQGAPSEALLRQVRQDVDLIAERIASIAAAPAAGTAETPAPAAPPEQVAPGRPETARKPSAVAAAAADPGTGKMETEQPARQQATQSSQEMTRVSAGLLDQMVSLAGETSIVRGRVQQEVSDFGSALGDLGDTIERLRDQIRQLDSAAQEQVSAHSSTAASKYTEEDFDPLEMDRYTQFQELTRVLAERASDMGDLRETLIRRLNTADTLLAQQGRINTELQEGLMRTRMVPFSRLMPRLERIVRQVGRELGKEVELVADNLEGELDRNVLERMIAPLEHMLRNAVDHGLEATQTRVERGKPKGGTIRIGLERTGSDMLIRVSDDGGGINVDGVRTKAIERGLLDADADVSEGEVLAFIMTPGFSTAKSVTQISGRGVGMDVVNNEVKLLGGNITIESAYGFGTTFIVRLPITVSVDRAMMVSLGRQQYALPLSSIERILRVSPQQLKKRYENDEASLTDGEHVWPLSYLGEWLGEPRRIRDDVPSIPVLLVRTGDAMQAVHVDGISGSREIVVKTLGSQFAGVGGVSGATIMGDGSVVVILDLPTLMRSTAVLNIVTKDEAAVADQAPVKAPAKPEVLRPPVMPVAEAPAAEMEGPVHVLVVDDSVTVRKVTTRLLERKGYKVTVAKDGLEAVAVLDEMQAVPDVMLLDIEMPRMDGFEVASHVRNTEKLSYIPIVMISSRTGEKHRQHADEIGVNRFLGKPFQEPDLVAVIEELTARA